MHGMQNSKLLTLVYSEIRNLYHIETSQVIYNPMRINWMALIDIQCLTRKGMDFLEVH